MKIQLSIFFFLLTAVIANAQFTCGAIHKPVNTDVTQETVAIDRFNNAYSESDLNELSKNVSSSIQTGYFELFISDDLKNISTAGHPNQGEDFSVVVEKVFSDISQLINQRSHTLSCGYEIPKHTVKIIIGTDVCAGSDGCDNATSSAAGAGSPFYGQFFLLSQIDQSCQFVTESNVWLKMNALKEYLPIIFDGVININIENPNINYGIDTNNAPASDKIDLYSVVLHELLHVLGFTSRLTEDGTAKFVDGFNISFFTRYDQLLHYADNYQENGQSENVQSLMSTDLGSNCYQLSGSVTDFPGLIANNCNAGQQSLVFGENAIAPIAGGVGVDVPNALSHLSESCQGSNEDFVMDPSIQNGDDEREISETEKQILCALGYDVAGVECDACFVHAGFVNYTGSANDVGVPYFESCCDKDFFTGVNVPIYFTKEDIICNAIIESDTDIEITDIYMINTTGVFTDNGDGTYEFSSSQDGIYLFVYTLTNCDSKYSSTAVLQINVHQEKDECLLESPCDNLVCNSDNENLEPTNYINYQTGFDNLFIFENTHQNSVNVCSSNSNIVTNLAMNSTESEGQVIPLEQSLKPGCTISLSLDLATREGTVGLLNISGSEYKPCLPTISFTTLDCNSFGSNTIQNTCKNDTYIPYCLVTNASITNEHPGWLCPAENLILETYTWEIAHTGDTDINYLVMYNDAPVSSIWVDNVIVTQDCPPEYTMNAEDIEVAVNETAILEIEVCFEDAGNFQFSGAEIEIQVPGQSDFTILDEGDFINGVATLSNVQENSCVSVFLHFEPTIEGVFELDLISEVGSLCKEEEISLKVTVREAVGIGLDQLDEIPVGSKIHFYNQLGIELDCFPITKKEEVRSLYKPMITSVYPFTIIREGRIIVADKVYLMGN